METRELIPEPINHFSQTSKMPSESWSLPAGLTCLGSKGSDACKGCYAKIGFYVMYNARKARLDNMLAWKEDNWIKLMIDHINELRRFRFFDSGDGYEIELWEKIYKIVKASKHCLFWIPTRMYKFKEFRPIIDKLNKLKNCKVRFSSDSITGQYIEGLHGSVIIEKPEYATENMYVCPAYSQGGKCGDCRACWSKESKYSIIAYTSHGKLIASVYKNL